jgi:hypothetical protein
MYECVPSTYTNANGTIKGLKYLPFQNVKKILYQIAVTGKGGGF